eukprot:CAMPEP_0170559304 /NCGR_PEP_ID=MMETSP0211-20121228/41766_1 /TAXON_ID=311385 /ORGANISM="Pseudokeronopsis sp., Strain OXSARD2" /LENGTH=257 /DNA_ID=CAMNT_0010872189 /DNA_START=116 /DNA_END=889 /DNA_ORIENTATION=+
MTEEVKGRIVEKVNKLIKEKMIDNLCAKYHINRGAFEAWYKNPANKEAKEYERKLTQGIEEIFEGQNPKTFDYEIKEELKSKQTVHLAYKKLCDSHKYMLYTQIRESIGKVEVRRDDIVDDVIESSDIKWRQIFEHLHIELFAYENAFLEFKKAFHKHNFDYLWHCEMQKTEIEYYAVMGALWYLYKAGTPQEELRDDASSKESVPDPFSLPTNPVDYNYDIELPLMKNLSNEMMLILNTNFRVNFHKNQSELELKI